MHSQQSHRNSIGGHGCLSSSYVTKKPPDMGLRIPLVRLQGPSFIDIEQINSVPSAVELVEPNKTLLYNVLYIW